MYTRGMGIWIFGFMILVIFAVFTSDDESMTGIVPYDSLSVVGNLINVKHLDASGNFKQYYIDTSVDPVGFVFRMDSCNINYPSKRSAIRILNYGWKIPREGWEYIDSLEGREIYIPVKFLPYNDREAIRIRKEAFDHRSVALRLTK